MEKQQICVLFGGRSPEHEISEISAQSVIKNLDKSRYDIHMIGITSEGEWFYYTGPEDNIEGGGWSRDEEHLKKAVLSPDACDKAILVMEENGVRRIRVDAAFPVLHGEGGEDGSIQGLLELSGIPYVGFGIAASANSMDKTLSKLVFGEAGIRQAAWVTVKRSDDIEERMDEIEKKLGYPCFVKPAGTGSSVGVGKAYDRRELEAAIKTAHGYDRKVIVEEFIDGHEVECAVLGDIDNAEGTDIGEIVPVVDFYDFDAKYKSGATKLLIPAGVDKDIRDEVRRQAVKAFRAMDGQGMARVDFFIRKSDNAVILNEINTIPGFTGISMYPKLWQHEGLSYSRLLDRLLELAQIRTR